MNEPAITTIEELHERLDAAIQLEHATLPPYLTALYSLHPETNLEAAAILRAVLVEEMLHMTLAANLLNSLGIRPDLLAPDFMPRYPTRLPSGETDFHVHIDHFSPETLATFLKIERPARHPLADRLPLLQRCVPRSKDFDKAALRATRFVKGGQTYHYYSIGEFYQSILEGFQYLETQARERGETIFKPDPRYQIDPEYYYSGGGRVIAVTDLPSAIEAIQLIQNQGEGYDGGVFDRRGEISHYYRFEQLQQGRFYRPGDEPGRPTGEPFEVDWNAVYPVVRDPKLDHYPGGSELHEAAEAFNRQYLALLTKVHQAYRGEKARLRSAVWDMFRLKESASQLIRNPVPGCPGVTAGPTFELPETAGKVESLERVAAGGVS